MSLCFLFVVVLNVAIRFAEYRGALTIAMTNSMPHNNSENALAYNSSDKCNSLQ